jgi:DNA-binding transcriptional regulator YhcF (GntR family)
MARLGSNKPTILQARVIELSAQGVSGRKIARELNINRRTVARILAGPEAQRIVLDARERARMLVKEADAALHKSLKRGSSRTAICVLRGAGVFERRAEAIVRHHYQDVAKAQEDLESLEREARRDAERKFGRRMSPNASIEELQRENARLERLALIERERAANPR